MPEEQFPIQGIESYSRSLVTIPRSMFELLCAEHKAQYGGSQTIEDYARRGGFGVYEAIKLATDAVWRAQGKH